MKKVQVRDIRNGVTIYKVYGLGARTHIVRLRVLTAPRNGQPFKAITECTYTPDGVMRVSQYEDLISRTKKWSELFLGDCGFRFDDLGSRRRNYFGYSRPEQRGHALFFTLKAASRYAQGIVRDPVQCFLELERIADMGRDHDLYDYPEEQDPEVMENVSNG